jgi:hypothetical protein
MNKYFVVKDNESFNVYEKGTNNFIKTFSNHSDARKLKDHLNFGGGFDGWTPNFVCEKNLLHKYNIEK